MATLLAYRNDRERPRGHVALDNGDHVGVLLSADGLRIEHLQQAPAANDVLFEGGPDVIVGLCVSFMTRPHASPISPLDIILAAVMQLPSAATVREAFHAGVMQVTRRR